MPFPQLLIQDWKTLISVADNLDVGGNLATPYLFRGQEDADWTLLPSIHRAATNDGRHSLPPASELLRFESFLTGKFCEFAPNYLPVATLSATHGAIDWWPLMRHYGVPTRIIDWTASFYVALYFAVAKAPDKDGAIYVIHVDTLEKTMQTSYGTEAEFPRGGAKDIDQKFQRHDSPPVIFFFGRKTALVDRMISQQGVFMASQNIASDLEETLTLALEKVADPRKEIFRKFRIPETQKPLIMRKLRSMNVTASSLFPGLDGIGRYLDELVRNA